PPEPSFSAVFGTLNGPRLRIPHWPLTTARPLDPVDVQSPPRVRAQRDQLHLPDPGRGGGRQGGEPFHGLVAVGVVEHGVAADQGAVQGGGAAGQEQVPYPAEGEV